MTSTRTTPPRHARLGGWPIAVIAVAPLTALVLGASPATGLGTDVIPTAELNRPGSGGRSDSTERWSYASTEEVPG